MRNRVEFSAADTTDKAFCLRGYEDSGCSPARQLLAARAGEHLVETVGVGNGATQPFSPVKRADMDVIRAPNEARS
jgi:hypothetical protein